MKLKLLSSMALLTSIPLSSFVSSCADSKSTLYYKLLSLENVTRVDTIKGVDGYKEKYIVYFKQLLNPKNAEEGTFIQRIEFGFNDINALNVVTIGGYNLNDATFGMKPPRELEQMFEGCNHIGIEYRFFGGSKPSGLSNWSTELWDKLTLENATMDFHTILASLKTILKGKWLLNGSSKGGCTTDIYSMFDEENDWNDFSAYVSYSAPRCFSKANEHDIQKWVYHTWDPADPTVGVGNDANIDPAIIEQWVTDITTIQWNALENMGKMDDPDSLINKFWDIAKQEGYQYVPYVYAHPEWMFKGLVINWPMNIWQNHAITEYTPAGNRKGDEPKYWDKLHDAATSTTVEDDIQFFIDYGPSPNMYAKNVFSAPDSFPYEVQASKEMGRCSIYPSDLATNFGRRLGKSSTEIAEILPETDSQFDNFRWNMLFTSEQIEAFKHDETKEIESKLIEWAKTTKQNVIKLFGTTDPWAMGSLLYLQKAGQIEFSENIHVYVGKDTPHRTEIKNLTSEEQGQIQELFKQWLA